MNILKDPYTLSINRDDLVYDGTDINGMRKYKIKQTNLTDIVNDNAIMKNRIKEYQKHNIHLHIENLSLRSQLKMLKSKFELTELEL